jgi:hypothetical protein
MAVARIGTVPCTLGSVNAFEVVSWALAGVFAGFTVFADCGRD